MYKAIFVGMDVLICCGLQLCCWLVCDRFLEVTSTPTRPVDNVVITTKGLQDRDINILAGTTMENKGKLILTEIFPSVQEHDIL